MDFQNPADAMRAKIAGRLNCLHCTHVSTGNNPWCDHHYDDPFPRELPAAKSVCGHFSDYGKVCHRSLAYLVE